MVWTLPPLWNFQFSFVLSFKNFGFGDPPPPQNFQWPSMGQVWIFSWIANWHRYKILKVWASVLLDVDVVCHMPVGMPHAVFSDLFCTVYRADMPNRLPVSDFVSGLVTNILTALKYWLHYTLVALAWLGVVPITACECRNLLYAGLPFVRNIGQNYVAIVLRGTSNMMNC